MGVLFLMFMTLRALLPHLITGLSAEWTMIAALLGMVAAAVPLGFFVRRWIERRGS